MGLEVHWLSLPQIYVCICKRRLFPSDISTSAASKIGGSLSTTKSSLQRQNCPSLLQLEVCCKFSSAKATCGFRASSLLFLQLQIFVAAKKKKNLSQFCRYNVDFATVKLPSVFVATKNKVVAEKRTSAVANLCLHLQMYALQQQGFAPAALERRRRPPVLITRTLLWNRQREVINSARLRSTFCYLLHPGACRRMCLGTARASWE